MKLYILHSLKFTKEELIYLDLVKQEIADYLPGDAQEVLIFKNTILSKILFKFLHYFYGI